MLRNNSFNERKVTDGSIPRRALSLVLEWANDHRNELKNNWESLKTTGEDSYIALLE
jgi:hypothetical protein